MGKIKTSGKRSKLTLEPAIDKIAPVAATTGAYLKTSFAPISNANSCVLILGSLPGDKSLALSEYYGHPQNRFWRIMAAISGSALPANYNEKKRLLTKNNIAVWDVAHKATRIGSLDSAIQDEEPNDIDAFITSHPLIHTIAFNGKKSEAMYNRFFKRKSGIRYISLPSSSPANAGINFENICKAWQQLLT